MRRFNTYLLASILTIGFSVTTVSSSAQTPHSQDSSLDAQAYPEFHIVAIGDYPEGYFRDIPAERGAEIDLSVSIENSGQVAVDLKTYKVNALSTVNGGFTAGAEEDSPKGVTAWMDYPTESFTLLPGEQRVKQFTVSIPRDAESGQYVSGIMVEAVDELAIPGSDQLRQKLGYVISLSVVIPGDIAGNFELGDPTVSAVENMRIIEIPIQNTGNYLVRPAGTFEIRDEAGQVVHVADLELGSIYGGLSTIILESIPPQMPPGSYLLSLSLKDGSEGAEARLQDWPIIVPDTIDPTGLSVLSGYIAANADPIAFAKVDISLNNGGQQIPASNVMLEVIRDGELVEEYPLATNQVLLTGENQFTERYIPAEMWESGTYTFNLIVSAVDPNGGQETILLDEELDATIGVP
jgi:hypothetical protein